MNEYVLFIDFFKEVDVDDHKDLCVSISKKLEECKFYYTNKDENRLKVTFKACEEMNVVEKNIDDIIENYRLIVEKHTIIYVS